MYNCTYLLNDNKILHLSFMLLNINKRNIIVNNFIIILYTGFASETCLRKAVGLKIRKYYKIMIYYEIVLVDK